MNTIVSLAFLLVLSVYGAQGLSCYCRKANCESTESLKRRCKGGLVDDVCMCCKTCAKVEGEACGGYWDQYGTCDQGLFCKGKFRSAHRLFTMTRGICTKRTAPTVKVTQPPTSRQNILKTTEISHSKDKSGDTDSESSGGEESSLVYKWFTSLELKEGQQTTELPTVNPTEKNSETSTVDPSVVECEILISGDGNGDNSEGSGKETNAPASKLVASTEPELTQKTTELPTNNPTTEENEPPTSQQNILKTTEISRSGDKSGDTDSESSGEEESSLVYKWFTSLELKEGQQTTELPTVNPTEKISETPTVDPHLVECEIFFSGDGNGDNSEGSGKKTSAPATKLIASTEPELTQETTELPTNNPTTEENESILSF